MFERFRQADDARTQRHTGLGLGLSIVCQLVGLHGGTVHAASEDPSDISCGPLPNDPAKYAFYNLGGFFGVSIGGFSYEIPGLATEMNCDLMGYFQNSGYAFRLCGGITRSLDIKPGRTYCFPIIT